ncbi:MAG: hypothetical protein ACO1RX_10155 [Candidatus Sericytochromatia bacterium]
MIDLPSWRLPSPSQLFQRWLPPSAPSVPLNTPLSRLPVAGNAPAPPAQDRLAASLPVAPGRSLPSLSLDSTPAVSPSAAVLPLPPRAATAPSGSQFWQQVQGLDFNAREAAIRSQILAGNVPDHLRHYREVPVSAQGPDGSTLQGSVKALPDYLAVGSNDDYVLVPMTPLTAQQIAAQTGTLLPTRKLVNTLYSQAEIKLAPRPKPPGAVMQSTRYYQEHDSTVQKQREAAGTRPGQLIAGHKKDVVITNLLDQKSNRVAIYGWHQPNGKPIQPLSTIHEDTYSDYSHGVRLIAPTMTVNGVERPVAEVLRDPVLSRLISDEGVIRNPSAARR